MQLGLDVSQHQRTWAEVRERTCLAEEMGFAQAWVFDHFQPLYGDRKGPCLEGWTLLGALAATTRRIRLGALVTGITYRHPSLLAAEAVTVDHVSGGRLELGVGAAWHEAEHHQMGFEFPAAKERIQRLEEGVQVMRLLMTEEDVSFDGRYYQLRQATYRPRPVQRPHPPIWIGGGGEQLMLPLVGRQADVWHAFGQVETLERKARLVDEHARRAGRDPKAIGRSSSLSLSGSWDEVRRRAEGLRRIGFGSAVVSWPAEGQGRLEEFATKVLPEVQAL